MPWRYILFFFFAVVSAAVFVAYYVAASTAGHGELLLPLDDTYIHFQYAKQLASGQPFVYNPGQPATSGATSLLYPVILAVGYLLGFQGLNLALWAMLIGMAALFGSLVLIYALAKVYDAPEWLAVLAALAYALTGAVAWHYMSGMETGLMTLLVLATLYTLITRRFWPFIASASLLALMRPEGGALAVLAVGVMFIHQRGVKRAVYEPPRRWLLYLFIPVLMLGVQPLVNLMFTGSAVATGNSVKSILGTVPFYWDDVIRRVLDNFVKMWSEWLSGSSPREGLYMWGGYSLLAIVGLVALLERRDKRVMGVLIALWLLAGAGAISTLETAFWHFKRYQMPLMALFFPLAAWGAAWILDFIPRYYDPVRRGFIMIALLVVLQDRSASTFWQHFVLNGRYVYDQPYQMAKWLQANTLADAVVAVHDVGMMRYMGGRTTLDMVGLTTPGAAAYWRNGPGSVAEFLIQQRPDYIASYGHGHGYGLGMIEDSGLYGENLASFRVTLDPNYNVALAADVQGVYKPDWSSADYWPQMLPSTTLHSSYLSGFEYRNFINVADIDSEAAYNYQWHTSERSTGFATEIHGRLWVAASGYVAGIVDGNRRIDELESFTLSELDTNKDVAIATRLHAGGVGTLQLYVNDVYVDSYVIPTQPGTLAEIIMLIPTQFVTPQMRVSIVPKMVDGYYEPASHAVFQGEYQVEVLETEPAATFQDGQIVLLSAHAHWTSRFGVLMNIQWYTDGSAQGDYKEFVHILDGDGNIVAQHDQRPLEGLPPGNWLPGEVADDAMIPVAIDFPPGKYRVAIGLYDPVSLERLQPESDEYEISDGRLFIGEIEVE